MTAGWHFDQRGSACKVGPDDVGTDGSRSICLLHIDGGTPDNPICCSTTEVELESLPYHALTYAWGAKSDLMAKTSYQPGMTERCWSESRLDIRSETMTQKERLEAHRLGSFDVCLLIINKMIGTGIFAAPTFTSFLGRIMIEASCLMTFGDTGPWDHNMQRSKRSEDDQTDPVIKFIGDLLDQCNLLYCLSSDSNWLFRVLIWILVSGIDSFPPGRDIDENISSWTDLLYEHSRHHLFEYKAGICSTFLQTERLRIPKSSYTERLCTIVEGTCRWILDEEQFICWRGQSGNIFWLSGSHGTGKSTLTTSVTRELEVDRRIGEYIVFYSADADVTGIRPVEAILCGILVQMLLGKAPGESRRAIKGTLKDLICNSGQLSRASINFTLSRISHNLNSDESIWLFLDGLDEFGESPELQNFLLDFVSLANRPDSSHRIKCFIATRPSYFPDTSIPGALKVDLDYHQRNRSDVTLYVHHVLMKSSLGILASESEHLVERLVAAASGSFLSAQLIIGTIELTMGPNPTLVEILNKVPFPSTITPFSLYHGRMNMITEEDRDIALSALRWVTYAARPLQIQELINAIQIERGTDLEAIEFYKISAGLLVIDENQAVRLVHPTVREYLRSHRFANWDEVSSEAHELIAHSCMKALGAESLLQSLRLCKISYPKPLASKFKPLSSYAIQNFIVHYKLAEESSSFLAGSLHSLLQISLGQQEPLPPTRSQSSYENNNRNRRAPSRDNTSLLEAMNKMLVTGARLGFRKLVKLELDMGADVNYASTSDRFSPLWWASATGHYRVVELLLKYGANSHLSLTSNDSPLLAAVSCSYLNIAQLLSSHRAEQLATSVSNSALIPMQALYLRAVFPRQHSSCRAIVVDYEIKIVGSNMAGNHDDNIRKYPLITIHGKSISRDEWDLARSHFSRGSTPGALSECPAIIVKWYPGENMYMALGVAAKHGIQYVRDLLITAGNDKALLDRKLSLSELFASMTMN